MTLLGREASILQATLRIVRYGIWTFIPAVIPAFAVIAAGLIAVWLRTVGEESANTVEPWWTMLMVHVLFPVLYFVLVATLTDASARRLPRLSAFRFSITVALFDVSLFHYLIARYFDGIAPTEFFLYTALAIAGGVFAGFEARTNQESVAQMNRMLGGATQRLSHATNTQEALASVADNVVHPNFRGMLLWNFGPANQFKEPTMFFWQGILRIRPALIAKESTRGSPNEPVSFTDQLALPAPIGPDEPVSVVFKHQLGEPTKKLFERCRFDGAIALPLRVHEMAPLGLLMIGFSSSGLLRRWQLRGLPPQYQQLANIVAVTLQLQETNNHMTAVKEQRAREEAAKQEQIRARLEIGRDMHHAISGTYQEVIAKLRAAQSCLGQPNANADPSRIKATNEHLNNALELYSNGQQEVRQLVSHLRRESTRVEDLPAEVSKQLDVLCDDLGADKRVSLPEYDQYISTSCSELILSTVRESFTNIRKHSNPNLVSLSLAYLDNILTLDIYNDGIDRDPAADSAAQRDSYGNGLPALAEQAAELGGSLTYRPRQDGWIVKLAIPPVA